MEKSPSKFDLIGPDEAMRRYGSAFGSKSCLYRIMRTDPSFPSFKPIGSRKWMINADELPEWINARRAERQNQCYNKY